MSGFTKLVPEIIQSSIWNEPSDIRIVWITLLAVKDENGYVRGDVRTIARLANVDVEAAGRAIDAFLSPDPGSHTPDNEGRRIGTAAGGYVVLNHALYRGRDAKAEHAEYVKKWRAEREKQSDVIKCDSQVNHASASASVSVSDIKKGVQGETAKPHSFKQWTREDLTASVQAANADDLLLPDEVADFVGYWTEPTASGKFRFTLQKAWDTRLRMKTAFRMIYEGKRKVVLPIDEHPVRWLGGEKMWAIPGPVMDDLERRYAGIDIELELVKLNDWLHKKPDVQKTKSFRVLIENWLERAKTGGR